jgi:Permuted papain-like amidase enzyme, YaeF/YiiX, C92 family
MQSAGRLRRLLRHCFVALTALYALLLIPLPAPPRPQGAGQQAFLWRRDAFWTELETEFRAARALAPAEQTARFDEAITRVQGALNVVAQTNLPPTAAAFDVVETNFFQLAPLAAVCPERLPEFLNAAGRLRQLVKEQSEFWPMDSAETRSRIYRLLYGCRAAVEEVLLQSPTATNSLEVFDRSDIPQTPGIEVRGLKLHSGDILVSRGGAATSALIARGNDFPGNFSHIALVQVDEQTRKISVIEAHIESGVGVRSLEQYLADTKLRLMVMRLRGDLPPLAADPTLPHRAASQALTNSLDHHIPYDFAMDYHDPARQFCSEVAAAAYQTQGVKLWMGVSHLSTPGVTSWLAALGVRHFETQEPSDLEYDPQLSVVAEWRNSATLFQDHVDNAVIDAMLEGAERGETLGYNLWLLPGVRLAKAWSVLLNWFGMVGPIPEGMSATTALRVKRMTATHARLKALVLAHAKQFQAAHGYVPPYWELLRMARDAQAQHP